MLLSTPKSDNGKDVPRNVGMYLLCVCSARNAKLIKRKLVSYLVGILVQFIHTLV